MARTVELYNELHSERRCELSGQLIYSHCPKHQPSTDIASILAVDGAKGRRRRTRWRTGFIKYCNISRCYPDGRRFRKRIKRRSPARPPEHGQLFTRRAPPEK